MIKLPYHSVWIDPSEWRQWVPPTVLERSNGGPDWALDHAPWVSRPIDLDPCFPPYPHNPDLIHPSSNQVEPKADLLPREPNARIMIRAKMQPYGCGGAVLTAWAALALKSPSAA